jgi:CSLREA domain-containing protein
MSTGLRRWITGVAVAFGLAVASVLLAGCQPPPTFRVTVNTTADGRDAHPGDGICEMTTGQGDCSLRAAIDEANAQTNPAVITVPPGSYFLIAPGVDDTNAGGDLDLKTASLVIQSSQPGARLYGGDNSIDVRSGSVVLIDIATTNSTGVGVNVNAGASLTAVGMTSTGNAGPGLKVAAGATAKLVDTTLGGNTGAGADIEGSLQATYLTVTANQGGGLTGSGTATLAASAISNQGAGRDCGSTLAVTSSGYDEDGDGSCHLSATGDKSAQPAGFRSAVGSQLIVYPLPAGSPALDAIPVGGPNCPSTGAPADELGRPRGVNPCDLGALETTQVTFTVDTAADTADAHPGDGICADASGNCSMRAAFTEANAEPPDAIITIALTVDPVLSSPPQLTSTAPGVTVQGNGHTFDLGSTTVPLMVSSGHLVLSDLIVHGVVDDASDLTVQGGSSIVGPDDVTQPTTASAVTVDGSVAASLEVNGATIRGGTAISGGFEGVDDYDEAHISIIDSTIIGTKSDAVDVVVGDVAVTDSTIDGTTAGLHLEAGALPSTVTASTVWAPQHAVEGSPITVSGSVLEAPGLATCTTPVTSAGFNASPDTSCGLTHAGDQQGNNPLVGPLAANGGPTPSRLPYKNAPILDAIPKGTPGLCVAGATDQRGVARPQGSACDIGAVEGRSTVSRSFHESLTVEVATDTHDLTPGDGVCADASGHCSLRAAIDEANAWPGPDAITIAAGINPTLTLAGADSENASGDLDVRDSLTIHGNGAVIDAAGLDRVVHHWGGSLELDDLTLQDGEAGSFTADGLASDAGTLTLEQVTVTRNTSTGPYQTSAISIASTATISDSTLSRNGSSSAVEVRSGGRLTVRQSTVSENGGNGLAVDSGGSLALRASTLVADGGAALSSGGTVTLAGNILSGGSPTNCASSTGITSEGYNLVTDSSCQATQATDHVVANALLSPLVNQGGPTQTQVPYQTSPALDLIPVATAGLCDATTPTDQRGVSRPQGPACDAGATEGNAGPSQPPTPLSLTVNTSADTRDADPGDGVCADAGGQCSLRAAIDEANAWPTADTITIAAGIDPTLTRAGNNEDWNATGDLDVRGDLTIHGGGATVSAAGLDRVLDDESGNLSIDHLTVTGGLSPSYPLGGTGGGILAGGNLTLDHVTVSGNTAGGPGGGVATYANLAMTSSTVTENQTQTSPVSNGDEGSGIYSGDTATISGSRIYDNTGPANDESPVALYAAGPLTLTTSRVDHNPRGGVLTASANGPGGGTITDSTIDHDGPVGVLVAAPTTITDSTITANTIGVDVGLTTTITSSTIVGNTGAALNFELSFQVTLTASLLSTPSPAPLCIIGQPDVTITVTSGGYNRATDTSCGLTRPTDQQAVVLSLGVLGPNGGTTPTIVPNAGSPGVDAIPVGTAGLCDGTEPADQRGVSRPQGPACDVGSVER